MKKIALFIILLMVLFGGCKSKEKPDYLNSFPDIALPLEEMNKDIDLIVTPRFNTFKLDGPIQVLLQLKTNHSVLTRTDGNILMYLYDDVDLVWKQINDLQDYNAPSTGVTYNPTIEDIIIKPGHEGEDGFFVVLHPVISDFSISQELLIITTGNLVVDGKVTDEMVGAYEIITLKP